MPFFDLDEQEQRSFLAVVRHTVLEGELRLVRFSDSSRGPSTKTVEILTASRRCDCVEGMPVSGFDSGVIGTQDIAHEQHYAAAAPRQNHSRRGGSKTMASSR